MEMAEKSVMQGYSFGDAPSEKIARYLERKADRDRKPYVYGGYVFIFSAEFVLITTWRLPHRLLLTLKREQTYVGNEQTKS